MLPALGFALVAMAVLVRIALPVVATGATPGRLVVRTALVNADATPVSMKDIAVREGFVLLYAVFVRQWAELLIERIFMSWWLKADPGRLSNAPIPQDRSTATVVATRREIARVRAHDAAQAASVVRAATRQAPSVSSTPTPVYQPPHAAHPPLAARPPVATQRPVAPAPPRLSAAPFIPAIADPDVQAARDAQAAHIREGGMAVHSMPAPEVLRRIIAATIDYALIASVGGLIAARAAAGHVASGPSVLPFTAQAAAATLIVWFLIRPVAIAAIGQTPGQFVMHYRVYTRGGARVGLGKAMLREASGWGMLMAYVWAYGRGGLSGPSHMANADLFQADPEQGRLQHDVLAETWPVRI
jgi:uncharacterized RDD family membrane protein YckC